jgi:thiamine biosynthesis lipoprotein
MTGFKKKTNRRQFLRGKPAIDALTDLRDNSPWPHEDDAPVGTPSPRQDRLLFQIGRRAMACEFQVLLGARQQPGSVDAAMEALDLLADLEEQLSVFRPHSEVSQINRSAATRPVLVEPQLFELLLACAEWSRSTGGAFDITTGPLAKLWGFHTRRGQFPSPEQIADVLTNVGAQHVALDQQAGTVHFRRPAMALNLGSVGKGYALDRCADVLSGAGVANYMIHGGHSSILARGARLSQGTTCSWRVALRHPLRPERRLAEIRLQDQALGTSGSGQQFFYHRGRRYGHVLDPRTGTPAEGVLSATVLAPRAVEADALATAFFVMGVDAVQEYCARRPELSAVLVIPGARQGTVALEIVGQDDGFVAVEP